MSPGSNRGGVTRPDVSCLKTSWPDPTRDVFENLLAGPAGRVMTREKHRFFQLARPEKLSW